MPTVTNYEVIGVVFDILAALISLLDLITDVGIMVTWYNQSRLAFFWISFTILILAQISYIIVFYLYHGIFPTSRNSMIHSIISVIFTLPFAPVLSFIFYLVFEQDSFMRKVIDKIPIYNIAWYTEYRMAEYTSKKLLKYMGFITEAIVEGMYY